MKILINFWMGFSQIYFPGNKKKIHKQTANNTKMVDLLHMYVHKAFFHNFVLRLLMLYFNTSKWTNEFLVLLFHGVSLLGLLTFCIHIKYWHPSSVRRNRLTFLRCAMSTLSVSFCQDSVSKIIVVMLATLPLIYHNVVFFIDGKFTGLMTSISNDLSTISIFGEVILRDKSRIIVRNTKMHFGDKHI